LIVLKLKPAIFYSVHRYTLDHGDFWHTLETYYALGHSYSNLTF